MTDSEHTCRSACSGCEQAVNAINGLRCTRLHKYVEYARQQPCTRIITQFNNNNTKHTK